MREDREAHYNTRARDLIVLVGGAATTTLLIISACSNFGGSNTGAPVGAEAAADGTGGETGGEGGGGDAAPNDSSSTCAVAVEPTTAPDAAMCGGVNLQSSDGHCGECNHSCLGLGCTNGACNTVALASQGGSVETVDRGSVYWVAAKRAYRAPVDGGMATLVYEEPRANRDMFQVRLGSGNAANEHLLSQAAIYSLEPDGGSATQLWPPDGGDHANVLSAFAVRTNNVVASHYTGPIYVIDKSTGQSITVTSLTAARAIAILVDGAALYFFTATTADPIVPREIARFENGNLRSLAALPPGARGFAQDETHLYFADEGTQAVYRVSKTTQAQVTPEMVAKWSGPENVVRALGIDNDFLYWVAGQASSSPVFFKSPKCGGSVRRIGARDFTAVSNIVAPLVSDGTYLYWGAGSAIQKTAR